MQEAPTPVLAGLGGLHHGVRGVMEVLGGVLHHRGVAAGDVAAFEALAQRHPPVPLVEAALADRVLSGVDGREALEVAAAAAGEPSRRGLPFVATLLGRDV